MARVKREGSSEAKSHASEEKRPNKPAELARVKSRSRMHRPLVIPASSAAPAKIRTGSSAEGHNGEMAGLGCWN